MGHITKVEGDSHNVTGVPCLVEQGSSPIVKLIGDNRSITDNNVIDISIENSIRIGSGNFFVINIDGTGQVTDVDNGGGGYFYFVSVGQYPVYSGETLEGVHSGITGAAVRVFVSNTSTSGCLVLYVNTTPIDSLAVPYDGNYTFNNITFGTGDLVEIKYTTGNCP